MHIYIYIKRSAKRLSAKFSCERSPIETKLSQIRDATPGLNLRGATCAKKLLPRSARQKPRIDHPPSWIYGENIRFPGTLLCCQYKRRAPTVVRKLLPQASTNSTQTFPFVALYTPSQHKVVDVPKEAAAKERTAKTQDEPTVGHLGSWKKVCRILGVWVVLP